MSAAANRQGDDIVIAAFDAAAGTGVDGATSVVFDTAFSFTIAASGNMDVNACRVARRLLEAAENEEDDGMNMWFAVLTASGRESMLAETEVTSSDFNTVKALVQGQVDTFLGFKFLKSQRTPIVTATDVRSNFFWVKSSMGYCNSQTPRGFMDILPTKRHSIQVRYEMDAGATRLDEKGVVRVLSDET